jgi:hypothetical protein
VVRNVRGDQEAGAAACVAGDRDGEAVMSEDELADIERIWTMATPGPWQPDNQMRERDDGRWLWGGDSSVVVASSGQSVVDAGAYFGEGFVSASEADMTAICAAPEHARALLAEVRRLRAEVDTLETQLMNAEDSVRRACGND